MRNKIKFTEGAIKRLPAPDPSGKPTIYWDQSLKGFGVLVSGTTETKCWCVQRGTRVPRRVIERVDLMPLDEAGSCQTCSELGRFDSRDQSDRKRSEAI